MWGTVYSPKLTRTMKYFKRNKQKIETVNAFENGKLISAKRIRKGVVRSSKKFSELAGSLVSSIKLSDKALQRARAQFGKQWPEI